MGKGNALDQLGFKPLVDYRLFDNSDGNGEQMEWLSDQPQPSDAEIAAGQVAWDAEQIARQERLDSVKTKLESLGFTAEELREAFGI